MNDELLAIMFIFLHILMILYCWSRIISEIMSFYGCDLFDIVFNIIIVYINLWGLTNQIIKIQNLPKKELHCIDLNENELIAESCSNNMSCVIDGKTILVKEYWEVIKDE